MSTYNDPPHRDIRGRLVPEATYFLPEDFKEPVPPVAGESCTPFGEPGDCLGFDRRIGTTDVSAGIFKDFREAEGEDGPYTRRVALAGVEARTARGGIFYAGRPFGGLDEAIEYVQALPEDFDPVQHGEFHWSRNEYGSRAYVQEGDEDRQIEEERNGR
jgi:hypothetical protein